MRKFVPSLWCMTTIQCSFKAKSENTMATSADDCSSNMGFDLNIDLRPVDTLHTISVLKKYLAAIEQQMPIIRAIEIASLESDRPAGNDEEEQSIFSGYVSHLENVFDEDLFPTMRYSCIVFLHTMLETQLRSLCNAIRQEKDLPISLSDLRGSAIEQARDYLKKLAGIRVSEYPEWSDLRTLQKVRDCIVHQYGFLNSEDSRHQKIRALAESSPDLEIICQNRISPSSEFCVRQLSNIESFLKRLMIDMGWKL